MNGPIFRHLLPNSVHRTVILILLKVLKFESPLSRTVSLSTLKGQTTQNFQIRKKFFSYLYYRDEAHFLMSIVAKYFPYFPCERWRHKPAKVYTIPLTYLWLTLRWDSSDDGISNDRKIRDKLIWNIKYRPSALSDTSTKFSSSN